MPEGQIAGRRRVAYGNYVVLACITLLGLCLRLYRLDAQSIWFDEMNALVQDPHATLAGYLADVHVVNPDHLPLYFVVLFGWTRYVSDDPVALRMLSVGLGTLCIPMLYSFGRQVFSPRAGLIAALCLALSPIHIYMHQAIRYHALLELLTVLSLLLTLRAAASRAPGWLALHAAVCWAAVFTHLTAALPVLMEYAYLSYCLVSRHSATAAPIHARLRALCSPRGAALALLQGLIVAQCLVWFSAMHGSGVTWYALPSLGQWWNDLCGDVVVYLNADLQSTPLLFNLPPIDHRDTMRLGLDWACLLFFTGALAWGILRAFKPGKALRPRIGPFRFAIALAVVPITLLTLLSLGWHPVVLPRYTLFSSYALFVTVGAALAGLRHRAVRAAMLLALAGLFAAQLALLLPNLAGTDFIGVRKQLQRAGAEGENLVTIYMTPDGRMAVPSTRRILKKNLGDFDMRVILAYSLAGALTQNLECLASDSGVQDAPRRTWLLVEHWTGFPEQAALETSLHEAGVAFTHWQSTNLHLYELRAPRGRDDVYVPAFPLGELGADREDVVAALTGLDAGRIEDPEILEALEWAVPKLPIPSQGWPLYFESLRAMQVCPKAGRLIGEHVLKTSKDIQFSRLLFGLSYLAENEPKRAHDYLSKLPLEYVAYVDEIVPGFSAIVDEDYPRARAEMLDVSTRFPSRIQGFFRYLFGINAVPCDSSLVPIF